MHALVALALASALVSRPPALTTDAARQRYEAQCAAAPARDGAPCKALQYQLEAALYEVLRALYEDGETLPRDVLRTAAAAEAPRLAAFGLERLADAGEPTPEERALAVAALDSPWEEVREAGFRLVGNDPPYDRWRDRAPRERFKLPDAVAQTAPTPEELGVPAYPGARYRPFASGPNVSLFTTRDPQDKVLAFYAKGGKATLTPQQLDARNAAAQAKLQQDPMAMVKAMQDAAAAGKDPQSVINEMVAASGAAGADWNTFARDAEGMVKPTWVVVEKAVGASKVPTRMVLVFRDALLGETAVLVPRPPPTQLPDTSDPEAMPRLMRIQMLLSQPVDVPEDVEP